LEHFFHFSGLTTPHHESGMTIKNPKSGDPSVTNPWDEAPSPSGQLPKSELNPLMNPTLGRNLGRWAQVYFTTPPEKREQAVKDLLRELQKEPLEVMASKEGGLLPIARERTETARLVFCPACRRENDANHRFCVICGAPLRGDRPHIQNLEQASAETPAREGPAPVSLEQDMEWLRGKTLSLLRESAEPADRKWKYVVAGLAILLAGFGYLQWISRSHPVLPSGGFASPSPAPVSRRQTSAIEPEQPAGQQESPARKTATVQTAVADQGNVKQTPVRTSLPAQPTPQPDSRLASSPRPEAENGTQELLLAQRYLQETGGSGDTVEAAKWLWKSVGKQNTAAALLLADLYVRGDGVPQSCDQARLLLVAAVKRGAADAAQKLRTLDSSGCQ
jgi:hypothetical protein